MGMCKKLRKEGCVFNFLFLVLIESQTFVPNILPSVERKEQFTLVLAFISEALGIVKSDSRDKSVILVGYLGWASLCIISTQSRDRSLVVTWMTFSKVVDWESLASHWFRLHHSCKAQPGGAGKDLIESDKAYEKFTNYSC